MHLLHDLGVVVAELRPHHRQRVAGSRALRRHGQEVRGLAARWRRGGVHGGGSGGRPRVERLYGAGIEYHRPLDPAAGERAVVEAAVDGRGRLGIVGEHDVLPRRLAPLAAERFAQAPEQIGVLGLAAPARSKIDPMKAVTDRMSLTVAGRWSMLLAFQ